MGVGFDSTAGPAASEVFVAVVTAEIGNETHERENLSFQRTVPAVEAGAVGGIGIEV